jgi:hypothetical protein
VRRRARGLALFALLVAVYAATLGLPAHRGADFAPGEARYLLAAESIVSDGDVDLRDEERERVYAPWTAEPLPPAARLTGGRLHEPTGVGFPLLLAPAYALGGTTGAQLLVAILLALGFVAAAGLARRLVPEPWATAAAAVAGLSPPAVGWATTISPEPVAATAVAVAALAALRVRDRPTLRAGTVAALAIGLLPWLGVKFLPVTALCAAVLVRWMGRRRRGWEGFVAFEVVLVSAVAYLTANERLYGGLTPYAPATGEPTGASTVLEHLERAPRLVGAWLDPDAGLLVWAPFGALAFLALWLLARSLHERLSVAIPGVVDVEVAAGFLAAICGVQLLVAGFLSPALVEPSAFPGRELLVALPAGAALAAWGLRHAPRIGALLAAVTLAASAWLLLGARLGDGELAPPVGPLPWGGAEPVVAVLVAAATLGLLGREALRDRSLRRVPV